MRGPVTGIAIGAIAMGGNTIPAIIITRPRFGTITVIADRSRTAINKKAAVSSGLFIIIPPVLSGLFPGTYPVPA